MKLIAAIAISVLLFIGVGGAGGLGGTVEAHDGWHSCSPWQVVRHFGHTEDAFRHSEAKYDLNHDGAVTVGDIIIASNCWLERHA